VARANFPGQEEEKKKRQKKKGDPPPPPSYTAGEKSVPQKYL